MDVASSKSSGIQIAGMKLYFQHLVVPSIPYLYYLAVDFVAVWERVLSIQRKPRRNGHGKRGAIGVKVMTGHATDCKNIID